jgi:hypothetical protein
MEREKELKKLINVLHRTARTAGRVQWMNGGENEARFAAQQYNRILTRLTELDPNIRDVFVPLPDDSTLLTVAIACRQVVSYYEDEIRTESGGWGFGFEGSPFVGVGVSGCDPKEFNLEDIGNFIRDRIHEATREWKRHEREWRERERSRRSCG